MRQRAIENGSLPPPFPKTSLAKLNACLFQCGRSNYCEFATKRREVNDAQSFEDFRYNVHFCRYYVCGDGCCLYPRIPRVYDILRDVFAAPVSLGLDQNRYQCFSAD